MEGDLDSIQDIFFDAKAHGWTCITEQAVKKIEMPQFPGSKVILYEHGPFRVLDWYMANLNSSTGITTIGFRGRPVWVMHYGGWYEKEAIPFLKNCLRQAYSDRRFYGGRGPVFVQDSQFTYVNQIERKKFSDFAGQESIFGLNAVRLGCHWYRGMSLLENNRKSF